MTEIRKRLGPGVAQVTLGHATADVSQIYAERDLSLAVEIVRKIGSAWAPTSELPRGGIANRGLSRI